jgi:preprotein translocase subunit SecA
MVSDEGKVIIIDESTGRPMPDRQWRDGLHQAVECKEGLEIHKAVDHAASITFQTYFQRYQTLAGMSGTLIQNAREIHKVYKTPVVAVPTNRPVLRTRLPDRIFLNEEQKFAAIVQEVKKLIAQGRPVLIGTCSVEKSERLAQLLQQQGIEPQVLNARQNAEEAKIVAQSGQAGRVTVATNMAGRGTDIRLGEGVRERGGLHVIGTELHESVRIDRQLLGRAGRQGDLGSGQFYLCWEDRILEALGVAQARRTAALARAGKITSLPSLALFRKAQRVTEKRHLRQRLDVMHYDKQRNELLGELGADPFVD